VPKTAAQKALDLDLTRTLYIGDDERDEQTARAAGCLFAMVNDDNSLLKVIQRKMT
jgi:D-glycero-D-manno-heptose 1,7-bisphosphate phosphatase